MADLNALMVFAKVVEANSFSEAARRLAMPTSTVSRKVAALEDRLGVRLLERSTRKLRLTDIGAEIFEHALRGVEVSDAIARIVSNQRGEISGTLRLSTPPSISDSLLAPLVTAFQASYPGVRVRIMVTDRHVDHITEGVDIAFRVGQMANSALTARTLVRYRHRLLASPDYLQRHEPPAHPQDLHKHRLLAFSFWSPEHSWHFEAAGRGANGITVSFQPYLAMNDYAGLATALVSGAGIGDLPPIVQPSIIEDGRLVEVMPEWRFRPLDLSLVHLGNRHIPQIVRLFKTFATRVTPTLFRDLPR